LIRAVCRLCVCALVLALGACKDRPVMTGRGGTGGGTGTPDGGLAACLEGPGALDRPPNGRLPCELIPPGLRL
jgi:hypothetical protein